MDTSNTDQKENEKHTTQLEDAWQQFRKNNLPTELKALIIAQMRLVFYVGAIHMFDYAMTAVFAEQKEFEQFYVDMRDEIDVFRNQLVAENETEKRKAN